MDEHIVRLMDSLEGLLERKVLRAVEQQAQLREYAKPAQDAYMAAIGGFGESGFSPSMTPSIQRTEAQRAVLKVFNAVFRYNGPRKTIMLQTQDLVGGSAERGRIVTVGPFGFGTRRTAKSNSVKVADWTGVTFILVNAAALSDALRKVGQSNMAKMLQALADVVPVTSLMDFPSFVRKFEEKKRVVSRNMDVRQAASVTLTLSRTGPRWYVDIPLSEQYGMERISLNEVEAGGISWMVGFQQCQEYLPLVARDAQERIMADKNKIVGLKDRLQSEFGNYLLGVSL